MENASLAGDDQGSPRARRARCRHVAVEQRRRVARDRLGGRLRRRVADDEHVDRLPETVRPISTTRTRSLAASSAAVYAYSFTSLVNVAAFVSSHCVRRRSPSAGVAEPGFVVPVTGAEYGCSAEPMRGADAPLMCVARDESGVGERRLVLVHPAVRPPDAHDDGARAAGLRALDLVAVRRPGTGSQLSVANPSSWRTSSPVTCCACAAAGSSRNRPWAAIAAAKCLRTFMTPSRRWFSHPGLYRTLPRPARSRACCCRRYPELDLHVDLVGHADLEGHAPALELDVVVAGEVVGEPSCSRAAPARASSALRSRSR